MKTPQEIETMVNTLGIEGTVMQLMPEDVPLNSFMVRLHIFLAKEIGHTDLRDMVSGSLPALFSILNMGILAAKEGHEIDVFEGIRHDVMEAIDSMDPRKSKKGRNGRNGKNGKAL